MNFRKLFSKVLLALLLVFFTAIAFAESEIESESKIEDRIIPNENSQNTAKHLQAVVSADESVAVGGKAEFSAEYSDNPFPERPAVFNWDFGDGAVASGEVVSNIFRVSGVFEVSLEMRVGNESNATSFEFFVFEKNILLLTDSLANEPKIKILVGAAREQNTFLDTAWGVGESVGFFAGENALTTALQTKFETLRSTDLIILWAQGGDGLSSLANFAQKLNPPLDFSTKEIIVISDASLDSLARLARGSFATLAPREILLTRSDALRDVILTDDSTAIADLLDQQAIPFRVVDSGLEKFKITAPLSFLVNYLISEGIPASVILLVLLLPVIATIVAFLKQVVGITTFGVYTPSVLTLSFLAIGWRLGIIVLFVVVFASILIRKILRSYRLAYTPRLAIVLAFVSLAIFAAIVLITYLAPLGQYFRATDLITASIFPMLIMSTLAEKFVSVQTEKGSRSAIQMFGELLLVSLGCYLVVGKWSFLQTVLLAHPEIIFLFMLFDLVLGRFTGLRITEYIRFREVIKKSEEE